MLPILVFLVAHWTLAILFQTVYLHRYASHGMFTMSRRWERVFHFGTFVAQGSSYLVPRAYAVMHREHHAFGDTARDPHAPHLHPNVLRMMWHTKQRYEGILHGRITPEARFLGRTPEWPALERVGDHVATRVGWGVLYTLFYVAFAPSFAWFLLLPAHFLMGPIHGAIVNWCGHKYGYRNFRHSPHDRSRNTLPVDIVTMGELLQNNHHQHPTSPNFAARRFELDPGYWAIRALAAMRIVTLEARHAAPRRPDRLRESSPRAPSRGFSAAQGAGAG